MATSLVQPFAHSDKFNDLDLQIMDLFTKLRDSEDAAVAPQGQPPFQPMTPAEKMFNEQNMAVDQMKPPTPGAVPGSPNALMTFLSSLAGGLGSELSKNPTYAANTNSILQGRREAESSAKAENAKAASDFENKQEELRLKNRLSFAEAQMKQALEKGEKQRYLKAEELKMRLEAKRDAIKADASSAEVDKRIAGELKGIGMRNENDLAVQRLRNEGDIATQKVRNERDTAEGKSASEDIRFKDFLNEERQRFAADPMKASGIGPWKKEKLDDDALAEQLRFYASARKANAAGKVRDYVDDRMETFLRLKFGDLDEPDNMAKAKAWLDKRGIR